MAEATIARAADASVAIWDALGPGVEPADLVGLLGLGGQDDDRHHLVEGADLLADLVAVDVGQHQVEDHQVGTALFHLGDAGATEHVVYDLEALKLQHVGEAAHDVGLVFDQQDALLFGVLTRRRRSCRGGCPAMGRRHRATWGA